MAKDLEAYILIDINFIILIQVWLVISHLRYSVVYVYITWRQ